jgi:hypothetical protein
MPVTLLCPNLRCRAILQVPDTCRGRKVRCGQCGITLTVPSTGGGAATPASAVEADAASAATADGKGKGQAEGKK